MNLFLESKEYQDMKVKYEKEVFKLFGNYCTYDDNKVEHKTAANVAEYFKNKKVYINDVEEKKSKKGDVTTTTVCRVKTFYEVWSEDPKMKEYKEVVFNCNVKKVKAHQFNLFNGFNHLNDINDYKKVKLDKVFNHLRSLVDYNEEHFTYIISWLAQLIQQPHILPHTCIIIISEEGTGKDLFLEFINECIGEKYTYKTDSIESVCGKFNSMLGGRLLINFNETNPVESRNRQDNIKNLITANKVKLESKYKDPVKSDNFARFMFFSNRLFAFPVEKGSRRPVIMQSSTKYLKENYGAKENSAHFNGLYKVFHDERYQRAFLEHLKSYDISNFKPNDFTKSKLHETLEENSYSPISAYLSQLVMFYHDQKEVKLATSEALTAFTEYARANNSKFDYSQTKFNVELENTFNVKKVKSCGKMFFIFNIQALKSLLEKEYKVNFSDDEKEVTTKIKCEDVEDVDTLKAEIEMLKHKLQKYESKSKRAKAKKLTVKVKKNIVKPMDDFCDADAEPNNENAQYDRIEDDEMDDILLEFD